jgi:Ca-activated chloride channel homolog
MQKARRYTTCLLCTISVISVLTIVCQSQSISSINGPGPLPASESMSITSKVQEVNLSLVVTDKKGRFVPNLTANDIAIQDNAKPPDKITYFNQLIDLPLRIALVIDGSDSVYFAFNDEKRAALNFLKHVTRSSSDLALIIGFNQETLIAQPATGDTQLLTHAIKALRPGGQTAVYDAVNVAIEQLNQIKESGPSRHVIILFTDGEDNASHIDLNNAMSLAQQNETTVYVLNLGYPSQEAQNSMKELAESTGGQFHYVREVSSIDSAFSKLVRDLRSQYAIGYKPANTVADGSFHRITVSAPNKLRLRYRRGYFAR